MHIQKVLNSSVPARASTSSSATAASTTQNLNTLLWDFFLHCCSKFCMVILFPAFRSLLYGRI